MYAAIPLSASWRRRGLPGSVRSTIAAATRWAWSGCACVYSKFCRLAHDRQLGFHFSDPTASRAQLSRFTRRHPGSCAAVDVVLLDPFGQRDGMNAEIISGLFLGLAGAHERDHAGPELRQDRGGAWLPAFRTGCQLVIKSGTQTVGQVKMSPTRAADPSSLGELRIMLRGRYWCLRRRHRTL